MRKRLLFPPLDPDRIADEAEGGCEAFVIKPARGRWQLEFHVRLKRSMHDRDIDRVRLARRFWIGFDGASPADGWDILWADVNESTLILHGYYRKNDLLELERRRHVRLSPRMNLLGGPAGVLLELRGVRFPNGRPRPGEKSEPPF